MQERPSPNSPLPPVLQNVVDEYSRRADAISNAEQSESAIESPLYHYTDGRGLKGIIESGQIWFTNYRHLNDPSELVHGIEMAHDVATRLATGADGRVRLFLELFVDMFRHANFETTLDFFIASFSQDRDELGQWRAYADNGRGISIGFSPHVFGVVEQIPAGRLAEFVGRVRYSIEEVHARMRSRSMKQLRCSWQQLKRMQFL